MKYDIVIVGAGISGATLAERYATVFNKKVLVIEKRNHIAGNCYDFTNDDDIIVPKYGPHFFHTNSKKVWDYVSRFTKWHNYEHRVLSLVDGKYVPVPVNIDTVNKIFSLKIKNEKEMSLWLNKNIVKIKNIENSEDSAISRVGKVLYEKIFKYYTKKQWDLWPSQLDALVMNRIPVRSSYEDRYFTDKYQGMPKYGYTNLFKKILSNKNIELLLNTDYMDIKDTVSGFDKLFFTGKIDLYFEYLNKTKLKYRSLKFKHETLNIKSYQPVTTVNYPDINIPYTRITEPKKSNYQDNDKTTIIKEYPTWDGEPYYPVPDKKNKKIYEEYKKKATEIEKDGIYFVGRLANYKYFNMDQAFLNSLELFENLTKHEK